MPALASMPICCLEEYSSGMTLFLDIWKFEAISLLPVFNLEEERHDECKNSERCEYDHWHCVASCRFEGNADDERNCHKADVLNPEDQRICAAEDHRVDDLRN